MGDKKASTRITADRMDAVRGDNMVIFTGSVVVSQKDFTLHSNKLTAYYTPGGREIREIVAVGEVRIIQPDREATSGKAVYMRGERVLILTENPVVKQGNDRVSGVKITFYLDEDRSIVEGDEQKRVNAVFHPGKSGNLFEGGMRK
ncbi:MAG: lipopolysaccharide transport periplasmic protein LptA [Thermodesulfobacteriota bacterium]